MTSAFEQQFNYELQRLRNYLNYIEDIDRQYKNIMANYSMRNHYKPIGKTQDLLKFEKDIAKARQDATQLYNELERIRSRCQCNLNVEQDLRNYINRANSVKLPIFGEINVWYKEEYLVPEEDYDYQEGVPTGAAAMPSDIDDEQEALRPDDNAQLVLDGGVSKSNIEIEEEQKRKQYEKDVKKWENRIENNIKFSIFSKPLLAIFDQLRRKQKQDAVGMINIASGKFLPLYTKDAVKISNINDERFNDFNEGELIKHKKEIIDKINEQFKDFNYDLNDVKGYIFKRNSAPVKRIKKSKEFKKILANKKQQILDGNTKITARFKEDYNLHNAFGSFDIYNKGFDQDGNLHLYIFDTYDFNKGEDAKVEAGRRQMHKGTLKGFFSIHDIIIKKKDLEKYGF